jgi:dsDNA-binding SOS-regulon protein
MNVLLLEEAVDWGSVLTQIILGVVGLVISALGTYATYFISKRIKDEKLKDIAASLNTLVNKAVLEVYQTYVEGLKNKNIFGEKEQKEALSKALAIIKNEMPKEVEEWLKENYKNADDYIKTLIESSIAVNKK